MDLFFWKEEEANATLRLEYRLLHQALLVQPGLHAQGVQSLRCCVYGRAGGRYGKARALARRLHLLRKLPVLAQRGLAHARHGQQTLLPLPLKEQALLRAVAEMALVINPASGHAPA